MRRTAQKATASRAGEGSGHAALGGHSVRGRKRGNSGGPQRVIGSARRQTILVAEPSPIFRSAARALLERRLGATVVDATDLDAVVAATTSASPDVALIDTHLPPDGGVAAISHIARVSPTTKTIAWITSPSAATVHEAVTAGAVGCLEKELSADELHAAFVGIACDRSPLSPKCAALLVAGVHAETERRRVGEQAARLSLREREVLELLVEGLRNRDIARRLFITEATVKRHVSSVLHKLETKTRREAAELSRTWLVSLPPVDDREAIRNGGRR
jgi:DNA-binding NarL/FixJ family response regulator